MQLDELFDDVEEAVEDDVLDIDSMVEDLYKIIYG